VKLSQKIKTEDRIQALKEHIFNDLVEAGNAIEPNDIKLIFQSPGSLRLRPIGQSMMKGVYEWHEFPLEERLTGRELMTLKEKVGYPYFLPMNHTHIVLFTVKQSFVLKLNGGDVKKWLANLENKSL
jgi:hypothetical protein